MRLSRQLLLIGIGLALTACSSISEEKPVDLISGKPSNLQPYIPPHCPAPPKKNPLNVSIYNKGIRPHQPYKVIGLETVSKYNHVGIKRQEANIRDTMRDIAAAMGGDAIIDLKYEKHVVTGKVVAYQGKQQQKQRMA